MNRKVAILIISISAILLAAVVAVVVFWSPHIRSENGNAAGGWSRYVSTELGVSFDYPSTELAPEPQDSFGTTTIRVDNHARVAAPEKQEIIVFTIVPTDPKEISSLDDWIRFVGHNNSPGGSPYVNGRFVEIDGARAVITTPQGSNELMLDVFYKNTLYSISFQNMSSADVERVWKSVTFLK